MIEFVIRHDGMNWILYNNWLTLSAPTLDGIDNSLKQAMKDKGMIKKSGKVKVFMAFDNSAIPQWMRQYAQHYFNRVIEIEG